MGMKKRNPTFYNEVHEREPRHLFLKGIKAFNRAAMVLIAVGVVSLVGHQIRQWALHSPMFELKHVRLRGHDLLSEEEIVTLARIEPRCNLFLVDAGEIRERLVEQCYIRTARIQRRWPATLQISIQERRPVAFIMDAHGSIDEEGVFLPPLSSDGPVHLPILSGIDVKTANYGTLLESEKIRWALYFLRETAEVCEDGTLEITNVDISDADDPLLYINGSNVPIRVNGADCRSRLKPLPWVFADLKRKSIAAEYIDIRFDGQIIVKPKTPVLFRNPAVSERDIRELGVKDVPCSKGNICESSASG
jgi:cell division protein FtsQ